MQRASKANSKPVIGYLLIGSFVFGILMLSNFGKAGSLETVFVFAIVGLLSLAASWIAKQSGYEPGFKWFDGKIDKHDIKWLAIGLVWLFAAVIGITSLIAGATGILAALFVGGIGLALVMYKSQNILCNIIVHASYNVLVILASQGVFSSIGLSAFPMSASPIFVPQFNFNDITPDNILGQSLLQLFAVAGSEEFLKVALAIAVSLITSSRIAIFGFSIAAWVGLHGILAYPVGG